jgi:hypothetical protein
MVGRLVEEQQVRAAHERAGQRQPHPPAARVAVDRTPLVAGREAQTMQQPRGAALGLIGADRFQPSVQLGLTQTLTGRFGLGQLGLEPAQFTIAVERELDRRAVGVRGVLGDMGDLPTGRDRDLARVGVQLIAQQGEQARLAAAVGPDQTDLPARIDGECGPFEQPIGAATETQVFQLQHEPRYLRAGMLLA